MKKNIKKIERALDIPESIIDDIPKVTCIGKNKVIIENYIGILEYDKDNIKINTGDGDIYIYGEKLNIMEFTKDDILIWGEIYIIEFEK